MIEITTCKQCNRKFPAAFVRCPYCKTTNDDKTVTRSINPMRGRMPNQPVIDRNVDNLVRLDAEYQRLVSARDHGGLLELIDRAADCGIFPVARKAFEAARELVR